MELYRLSKVGEELAHNIRAPQSPEWRVIFFVSQRGVATKEQILAHEPRASSALLRRLSHRGILRGDTRVNV